MIVFLLSDMTLPPSLLMNRRVSVLQALRHGTDLYDLESNGSVAPMSPRRSLDGVSRMEDVLSEIRDFDGVGGEQTWQISAAHALHENGSTEAAVVDSEIDGNDIAGRSALQMDFDADAEEWKLDTT